MSSTSAAAYPPDVDSRFAALVDAAHAYESALVAGDAVAATGWFDITPDAGDAPGAPHVSRFGPGGEQFGAGAVAKARAAQAAVAEPEWLHESVIALAPAAAAHLAVLRRGDRIVQRTQVWVRRSVGWRIRHAHVSSRSEHDR